MIDYVGRIVEERLSIEELRAAFLSSKEFAVRANRLSRVRMADEIWVFVDPVERDFGKVIFESGSWEPHIAAEIRRHVVAGDVFVDVGANVGVMSFQAAQAVGPSGKVISFEPNPRNVQSFLQGITENAFHNIDLYPFALSDRRQVFSLTGGSNSHLAAAEQGGTLIQSYVGDDILLAEARIDFIKLDIEGHEPAALKGLAAVIERHLPTILCEFNPRCLQDNSQIDPRRFAEQLFEISASCAAIEYNGDSNDVESPAALMQLWTERNRQAVQTGLLTDGMLHFDLLLHTGRRD